MQLTLPMIILIIAGIVALNIIVGVVIFILRRRSAQAERKRGFIIAPYAKPSIPPPYPELLISVNAQREKSNDDTRRAASPRTSLSSLAASPLSMTDQKRPFDITELPTQSSLLVPTANVHRGPSIRSADSISIYSTASAPLAFHERILKAPRPAMLPPDASGEELNDAPSEWIPTKPSIVHWKTNKKERMAAVTRQDRSRLRVDTDTYADGARAHRSRLAPIPHSAYTSPPPPLPSSHFRVPSSPAPVAGPSPARRPFLVEKRSGLSTQSTEEHVPVRPPGVPHRSPQHGTGHSRSF